jgi:pimeloyl-ACP methyl ester carboxylesterase
VVLKSLSAIIFGWCSCSLAYAAPTINVVPDSAFTSPHTLVPIVGARRLNIFCIGARKPTVILDSGLGGGMMFWRHVMPQISAFTRVCAYDRAGYGFSDPATRASDATNAADDLHRLLRAAGIPTPFVFVGHSSGGLYGVLFAATYTHELAGAVLVDPSFAHQEELTSAPLTAAQRAANDAAEVKRIAELENCLLLSRAGQLDPPKTKAASACMDTSGNPEKFGGALTRELFRQWSLPPTNAAYVSEYLSVTSLHGQPDPDSVELDRVHVDFGNKPLIILTRSPPAAGTPQDKAAEAIWDAQHDALAKGSSRGTNRIVAGAGHYIQIDQPAAVIDAVRSVVTEARANSTKRGD